MFIPSIYRTPPQVITATGAADFIISAVNDINYVRLSLVGQKFAVSSTNSSSGRVFPKDTTHITATADSVGSFGEAKVLIEEFIPGFFLQPFHYDTVDIAPGSLTGTKNTGLTLGPKAFIVMCGQVNGMNFAFSPIDSTQGELSLNVGTGVVTATVRLASDPGDGFYRAGFVVIDPR